MSPDPRFPPPCEILSRGASQTPPLRRAVARRATGPFPRFPKRRTRCASRSTSSACDRRRSGANRSSRTRSWRTRRPRSSNSPRASRHGDRRWSRGPHGGSPASRDRATYGDRARPTARPLPLDDLRGPGPGRDGGRPRRCAPPGGRGRREPPLLGGDADLAAAVRRPDPAGRLPRPTGGRRADRRRPRLEEVRAPIDHRPALRLGRAVPHGEFRRLHAATRGREPGRRARRAARTSPRPVRSRVRGDPPTALLLAQEAAIEPPSPADPGRAGRERARPAGRLVGRLGPSPARGAAAERLLRARPRPRRHDRTRISEPVPPTPRTPARMSYERSWGRVFQNPSRCPFALR